MTAPTAIEDVIVTHIPNAWVIVQDPQQDGQHFEAIVISDQFNDQSLLNQHKMVMQPLKAAFNESVHALALKTFSMTRWQQVKDNYPKIAEIIKEKYQHDNP